jgi:hypothetical protein
MSPDPSAWGPVVSNPSGDEDGDGTPNSSDADPFDPNNNDIIVTAFGVTTNYRDGWSTITYGGGYFTVYYRGLNQGLFQIGTVGLANNGGSDTTTGGSVSGGVSGGLPVVGVTVTGSVTMTSSSGVTVTLVPVRPTR